MLCELNEDSSNAVTLVDVDLSLSAYSNARRYYEDKKQSAEKAEKTKGAAEVALKQAEKKTMATLKMNSIKVKQLHLSLSGKHTTFKKSTLV